MGWRERMQAARNEAEVSTIVCWLRRSISRAMRSPYIMRTPTFADACKCEVVGVDHQRRVIEVKFLVPPSFVKIEGVVTV